MENRYFSFNNRQDAAGKLIFIEGEQDIPFAIARVYYICDVPGDVRRGFHAHKTLRQVLICAQGSCRILLDNGRERETVKLEGPTRGLLVDAGVWHEMYDFTPGAVLLVLASEHYDESDYIRDYDVFKAYRKENEK